MGQKCPVLVIKRKSVLIIIVPVKLSAVFDEISVHVPSHFVSASLFFKQIAVTVACLWRFMACNIQKFKKKLK